MNTTNTIWRNCNAILTESLSSTTDTRSLTRRCALESNWHRLDWRRQASRGAMWLPCRSGNNQMSYLIILLAVARLGAVAMPLAAGQSEEYREELVAGSRVHSIVLDKDDGWRSSNLPPSRYLEARMLLASPAGWGASRCAAGCAGSG